MVIDVEFKDTIDEGYRAIQVFGGYTQGGGSAMTSEINLYIPVAKGLTGPIYNYGVVQ